MLFDSPTAMSAIAICAFSGAFVSAVAGFGGAVTFLAFAGIAQSFVHGLPMRRVIMLSIFRSAFTNPVTVWLGRRDCDRTLLRLMLAMVPGIVFGSPLGQFALYNLPISAVRQCLGAVCLIVVLERLLKPLRDRRQQHASAAPDDPLPSASPATKDASLPRMAAAAVTGLFGGILGAALGTAGVPVMVFVAYFPLRKGATRNLVCCLGWPSQVFALFSFAAHDELVLARDWPALLCVVTVSSAGLWLGDVLHRRMPAAAIAWAVLLFLSLASVQMVAPHFSSRLAVAAALIAVAAYVHLVMAVEAAAAFPPQHEHALEAAPADIAPWIHAQNWHALRHRTYLRLGVLMGYAQDAHGGRRGGLSTGRCGRHCRLGTAPEPQPIGEASEPDTAKDYSVGASSADDHSRRSSAGAPQLPVPQPQMENQRKPKHSKKAYVPSLWRLFNEI